MNAQRSKVVVVSAGDSLFTGFLQPPKECQPQVWWWFDQSAPKEAITRDLEGLARVGVSGFHVYGGSATSTQWIDKVKWSLHEADRLGLDGVIMIGPAGCGHPQTDPRHAQKDLVFRHLKVQGGGTIRLKLPKTGVKETPKNADGTPKYFWDIATLAVPVVAVGDGAPTLPSGTAVGGGAPTLPRVEDVRDVSRFLDCDTDEFVWPDAPAGEWRIVRFGYVPKVFGWCGCYIDHMSRAAFDEHWKRTMDPLLAVLDVGERRALKGVMCDSWEAGTVSWTETFADEFRRRRGYDVTPWLLVKAGVKIESPARMNRFARDFDETVSELIAENHYAYQKEVANRHGLLSIAEAAGPHQRQGDVRRMQGRCDVAMGEFWMPSSHRPTPPQRFMLRDAANAAHVYGISEVLAEGFTGRTSWTTYPRNMKPCVDRAFCDGLTRVCYHGMKLSPWLDAKPGMVREWGMHYNPQVTWFEQSKAFNLYLSRCGWMLTRGRASADCLLYASDAINVFAGMKTPRDGLGEGYDYDICPTELLLQARVENGEIVLPSGVRYKVLKFCDRSPKTNENLRPGKIEVKEFPPVQITVREDVMLKIRELVEAGATLVGTRPNGPTSMNDSSERYHAAANVLWGPRGSAQPARRVVGKGLVLKDAAEARAIIRPDVVADQPIDWIHRRFDSGDLYFISNQKDEVLKVSLGLRYIGNTVELWNPVDGTRQVVTAKNGRLDLTLPEFGSVFCVGNAGAPPPTVVDAGRVGAPSPTAVDVGRVGAPSPTADGDGTPSLPIPGPWQVQFDPTWGGPTSAVTFTALADWTQHADPGIRHYSGTAVYRTTFDAPKDYQPGTPVTLDLGEVNALAEIVLNDRNLGVVWTKPFAVRIGTDVGASGRGRPDHVGNGGLKMKGNELEVRVTNLWPNRLIYDAGLPAEQRLTKTNANTYKPTDPLLPSGLLGPVSIRAQK